MAKERGWLDNIDRMISVGPTATQSRPAGVAVPLCSGPVRQTCIVDGDTGWEAGTKWRMAGIDAPEVSKPDCAAEKRVGDRATRRLQSLMSGGYSMRRGGWDIYGRRLVSVRLSNGRDAGEILIAEGLAQPWPNSGNRWCG